MAMLPSLRFVNPVWLGFDNRGTGRSYRENQTEPAVSTRRVFVAAIIRRQFAPRRAISTCAGGRENSPMSLSSAKNYALRATRSQDEKEAIELLSKAILELATSIETTDAKIKKLNKSGG
jgi:hypothetical protein